MKVTLTTGKKQIQWETSSENAPPIPSIGDWIRVPGGRQRVIERRFDYQKKGQLAIDILLGELGGL
jgi:hypothetical protein